MPVLLTSNFHYLSWIFLYIFCRFKANFVVLLNGGFGLPNFSPNQIKSLVVVQNKIKKIDLQNNLAFRWMGKLSDKPDNSFLL